MTQQLTLSVNTEQKEKIPLEKVNNPNADYGNTKHSVEYIKSHWAKDCHIFDLRWYQNNASREEVLERVKNNYIENAGHSSFLLPIMKDHGWSDEQITDYLMTLKEKHLSKLRDYAQAEIEKIDLTIWAIERVITCYQEFKRYCITLKQIPTPLREILEKLKDKHREQLREEKQKLNEKILRIAQKVKELERRCNEDTNL